LSYKEKKLFSYIFSKKIIIGNSVLVGVFSVILPGAVMEDYSSASAHSVIYKKVEKGYFYSPHAHSKAEILKVRDFKKMEKRITNFRKLYKS
jgi:hypothetical protein